MRALLVGHALRPRPRAQLMAQGDRVLEAREIDARSTRWPRAGSSASRWRASSAARNSGACRCSVTPDVLVPRPETETVVEAALDASFAAACAWRRCASSTSAPARARCCSRCCSELPNAVGIGTDISAAALDVARANAATLGLDCALHFRRLRYRRTACRARSI